MQTEISPEQRRQLAEQYELSDAYLYQCLTGRKAMKPREAVELESMTGGVLTRRHLRPKDWHLIWPELVDDEHPAPADEVAQGST